MGVSSTGVAISRTFPSLAYAWPLTPRSSPICRRSPEGSTESGVSVCRNLAARIKVLSGVETRLSPMPQAEFGLPAQKVQSLQRPGRLLRSLHIPVIGRRLGCLGMLAR